MFTVAVIITPLEQLLVVLFHGEEPRNRDKHVFPAILYLGFCTTLFVTCIRVAEDGAETIMLLKPRETLRDLAVAVFKDLLDNRTGVVKPDLGRYTSDMLDGS